MVRMPSSCPVRKTRIAISLRLATRRREMRLMGPFRAGRRPGSVGAPRRHAWVGPTVPADERTLDQSGRAKRRVARRSRESQNGEAGNLVPELLRSLARDLGPGDGEKLQRLEPRQLLDSLVCDVGQVLDRQSPQVREFELAQRGQPVVVDLGGGQVELFQSSPAEMLDSLVGNFGSPQIEAAEVRFRSEE